MAIVAPKPMEKDSLDGIIRELTGNIADNEGVPAARKWAKTLKPANAREMALRFLAKAEDDLPTPPPPVAVFPDNPLGKLRA